jgi:hypothetical protein
MKLEIIIAKRKNRRYLEEKSGSEGSEDEMT